VNNVPPDLLSNMLEVVKLTSLGSVVAMPELPFQARQAQSLTYNPTPIVLAALIYFLMLWPLVRVLGRLENRALAGRGKRRRLRRCNFSASSTLNRVYAIEVLNRGISSCLSKRTPNEQYSELNSMDIDRTPFARATRAVVMLPA